MHPWELETFRELCQKYLQAKPSETERNAALERLTREIGTRLAESGTSAVPAEDLAVLALLQARWRGAALANGSPQQPATSAASAPSADGDQFSDIPKGEEGIRQAQERLEGLPISDRMVITGDILSGLQAATVPVDAPTLTSTIGRARVNFVLRAVAGGAADSSAVGGPAPFTAFNDVATDRSRFNESTSRGNLYLGKVFYQQRLDLGENYLLGRVGIINLSDFFDTNLFANNEARQFVNTAFVNSAAFKTGISAPGVMATYHRQMRRDWLEALEIGGGYAVSRTDRAFTSPIWMGEIGMQTRLRGYRGNWRFGGSAGNFAGAGRVGTFHVSADHWVSPRIGVFGRYAVATSGAGSQAFGPVRQSYSGGMQVRFVDREDRVSAWSIGFSQAFGISVEEPLASERVLETYYRWQWTENISLLGRKNDARHASRLRDAGQLRLLNQ